MADVFLVMQVFMLQPAHPESFQGLLEYLHDKGRQDVWKYIFNLELAAESILL